MLSLIRLRTLLLTGVAASVLLLVAGAEPVQAGSISEEITIKLAKREDGPFRSPLRIVLDPGEKKNVYAKVKSFGEAQDPAKLQQISGTPLGWTIRWFKGDQDVSADVLGAGLEFHLGGGKAKTFRMKLKRAEISNNEACLSTKAFDETDHFRFATLRVNLDPDALCLIPI